MDTKVLLTSYSITIKEVYNYWLRNFRGIFRGDYLSHSTSEMKNPAIYGSCVTNSSNILPLRWK